VTEPQIAATVEQQSNPTRHSKPPGIVLPETTPAQSQLSGTWGVAQPAVKNVWVAVLLALFLGPFGMTYSTYLGALVMLPVSLLAYFYLKSLLAAMLVPVICAVWAGLAARSANSIY